MDPFPEPIGSDLDPRSRLASLLTARTAARDPLRGDPLDQQFAHFSDLGFCRLATHARRSGKTRFVPSADHGLLFHLGHTFEDWCADALADLADWNVRHGQDLLYAVPSHDGLTFGYIPVGGFTGSIRWELLKRRAVIGHPDLILAHKREPLDHLIDCKTTTFGYAGGERKTPTEAKPTDLLQTAAYAVALDQMQSLTGRACPNFSIWMGAKDSGAQAFLTYRTADFTARILHGLADLIADTDPKAVPPPPMPPAYTITVPSRGPNKGIPRSWLCARCSYTACPKNDNGAAFGEGETA